MTSPESAKQIQLSDVITLILASGWFYAVAFTYEVGYTRFFGIPNALIVADGPRLFNAASALVAISLLLFLFAELLHLLVPSRPSPLVIIIVLLIVFETIVVFLSAIGPFDWMLFLLLQSMTIGYAIRYLVLPLVRKQDGVTINERIEQAVMRDRITKPRTILGRWIARYGIPKAGAVVLVAAPILIAYLVGMGDAKRARTFFVVADQSNTVVLKIYGENVVTATFDPCTNEISGPITVRPLNSDTPLALVKANIGPLTPRREINRLLQVEDF